MLHEFQDLRDRGLAEVFRRADPQRAREVHAAADDVVAFGHVTRHAFAGQGRRVQRRCAAYDHAVHGDLLAGTHHNDAADGHLGRVDRFDRAVLCLQVRAVRADVHEIRDALAALRRRELLEQFADLVKQKHGDRLDEVSQGKCSDCRHGHQEVLIQHLAIDDAEHRLTQHVVTHDQVRDQTQGCKQPFILGPRGDTLRSMLADHQDRKQDARDDDPI